MPDKILTNRTSPEQALATLGLTLPAPAKPVAAYVPTRRVPRAALPADGPVTPGPGGLLYVSGQIPLRDGKLIAAGTVPSNVTVEQARDCARQCVLNALAAIKADL